MYEAVNAECQDDFKVQGRNRRNIEHRPSLSRKVQIDLHPQNYIVRGIVNGDKGLVLRSTMLM